EMRHAPVAVDRIAMESAADVVAHPAERHRAKRDEHHVACLDGSGPSVLAQEEQQLARPRKLRRVAKATPPRAERSGKLANAFVERARRRHVSPGAAVAPERPKPFRARLGRRLNSTAVLLPRPRN